MTASTEQERAEVIYTDQGINLVKDDVLMAFIPWEQAARRAQAAQQEITAAMQDAGLKALNDSDSYLKRVVVCEIFTAMLAAAPQPPECLMSEKRTTKPEAAPVQMPSVDTVGVMLELESRVPFVESQTTRRAMEAAVQLLRILAAHGIK